MSDNDRRAQRLNSQPFRRVIAAGAIWLAMAPGIRADPAPMIQREQIPSEMPPEVRLLVERLYSANDDECAAAVDALGAMGANAGSAAPFLASMLRGEVRHGRTPWGAAHALVRIGKASIEPTILAFQFGNTYSRMRGTDVFKQLLDERAIPVLVLAAADRMSASGQDFLTALNAFGETARTYLLQGMQDPNPVVRRRTASALPAFPTTNTVEVLFRALADRDAQVRTAAMEALLAVRQRCRDTRIPVNDNLLGALKDDDPSARKLAIRVITEMDYDRKTEALAEMAKDPDRSVGIDAIQSLGWIRTDEAFGKLVEMLDADDPAVRSALIEALGRAGGQKAVPHIRRFLGDRDPLVHEKAVAVLGSFGTTELLDEFLALLTSDDPILRVRAAVALGNLRNRRAVEPLKAALKDADKGVRMEALRTLCCYYTGKVRMAGRENRDFPAAADFPFRSPDVREGLLTAMSDSDIFVKETAFETLFSAVDPPETEAAIKALQDGDAEIRRRALEYLRNIRTVPPLDPVRALLKDPHPHVRANAIALLSKHGDRQSFDAFVLALRDHRDTAISAIGALSLFGADAAAPLIGALRNPDWEVRRHAAEVLARLDNATANEALLKLLDDPAPQSRATAIHALNSIPREKRTPEMLAILLKENISNPDDGSQADLVRRGPAAAAAVAKLLKDERPAVRLAAVRTLSQIGDRASTGDLAFVLADGSPVVREAAVMALAKLKSETVVPRIRNALADSHSFVREAAAVAVGQMGDTGSVGALLKALRDDNWHVRWAAADGLGRLRDRQIAPQLVDALVDPHWYVRQAAADSLGQIGDRAALPSLVAALDDSHWLVRSSAHSALCLLNGRDLGADSGAWRALTAPPAVPTPSSPPADGAER